MWKSTGGPPGMVLSEISQSEKDKYRLTSMCKMTQLARLKEAGNSLMAIWGRGGKELLLHWVHASFIFTERTGPRCLLCSPTYSSQSWESVCSSHGVCVLCHVRHMHPGLCSWDLFSVERIQI